jgi:PleD family two-component response regulator
MKLDLKSPAVRESLNVLLVGNNPADVETILKKLAKIRTTKVVSEIAFDGKTALERVMHFKPNHILIDDNIGKEELNHTVAKLSSLRKTKYVPITVIKNSNYNTTGMSSDVLDYLMKHDITGEAVIMMVKNSLKARRTQLYLHDTFKKRKKALAR